MQNDLKKFKESKLKESMRKLELIKEIKNEEKSKDEHHESPNLNH